MVITGVDKNDNTAKQNNKTQQQQSNLSIHYFGKD